MVLGDAAFLEITRVVVLNVLNLLLSKPNCRGWKPGPCETVHPVLPAHHRWGRACAL